MLLGGCGEEEDVMLVRFFVEAPEEGFSPAFTEPMTLSRSGLTYVVHRNPIIMERNITQVDLVRVQPGNRLALRFLLDREGRANLYRASVAKRDSRLLLTVNGVAIGMRVLEQTISDGVLYTFTEYSDEADIEQLAQELQQNVLRVHEIKDNHSLL